MRRAPDVIGSEHLRLQPPAIRRSLRGGEAALAAAYAALGLTPDSQSCRASVNDSCAALWLGPDERLLLAPQSNAEDLAQRLERALAGTPHALVDISHRQVGLDVSGARAETQLAAGCALDLELASFPAGMCTRTMLAKAEVVLWRTSVEHFHIEVARSLAAYVARFLDQAGRELLIGV
jgi:sarcosine oxidase subunit gamma